MSTRNSAAFSGLPQPFLEAMKKLFDILDREGTGWIYINGTRNILV
jgi:hypothetical protein